MIFLALVIGELVSAGVFAYLLERHNEWIIEEAMEEVRRRRSAAGAEVGGAGRRGG